jgi:hypothetical protein
MSISVSLQEFSVSTNAAIQAWIQFFHNNMLAFGWVQTTDTGQLNPLTVTAPAAGNDTTTGSAGYLIYHSNDGLTNYFLKVEFFRTSSVDMWLNLTVGWGSNGTGTITGNNATAGVRPNAKSATGTVYFAMAGNAGWVTFCAFVLTNTGTDPNVSASVQFALERDRDNTGAEVATGAMLFCYNNANRTFNFIPSSGTVPAQFSDWSSCQLYEGSIGTVRQALDSTYHVELKQYIGFCVPIKESGGANPCLTTGMIAQTDLQVGSIVKVPRYGVTHSYLVTPARSIRSVSRVLMRFE